MLIREETEEDHAAIRTLNRMAFRGDYEAELIDKLRSAKLSITSLVALEGNEVIGHLLFSRLSVEIDGRQVNAASLAPMAVRPDRQRQGIGSELIKEGLDQLRKKSVEAVIALGHTDYYPRFGFSANLTQKFVSPFQGMAEFMGLELMAGALSGKKGWVKYPEAFGLKNSN